MLSPRWQHLPLSGDGAAKAGGRWNAHGMSALYLSADHATAIAEYMQALVHPGTLTPYEVACDAVLDLTDTTVRRALGVDDALLSLAWRHQRDVLKREPETWTFAAAALAAGFDGLRVPSVVAPGVNLVLWRWDAAGARVKVVDPGDELAMSVLGTKPAPWTGPGPS